MSSSWLDDALSWASDNSDLVGTAASAATKLIGQSSVANANTAAAANASKLNSAAADVLAGGDTDALNELLAQYPQLLDLLNQNYGTTNKAIQQGQTDFGTTTDQGTSDAGTALDTGVGNLASTLNGGASALSNILVPAAAKYGTDLSGGLTQYGQTMDPALSTYGGAMDTTLGKAEAPITPYSVAGAQALQQLRQIAASDPSKLTLSQQRSLQQLQRDSASNLATSGLRGAGRSGVAAANDADAAFLANAADSNKTTVDNAISALESQGVGAAGTLSNLESQFGQQVAGTNLSDAQTRAKQILTNAGQVAGVNLGTAQTLGTNAVNNATAIGGAQLSAGNTKAANVLKAAQAKAAQGQTSLGQQIHNLNQYTSGQSNLVQGAAGNRAQTLQSIAAARAGALTDSGSIQAQAALTNAKNSYTGLGALSSTIGKGAQGLADALSPGTP